jgi:hypothetical protein
MPRDDMPLPRVGKKLPLGQRGGYRVGVPTVMLERRTLRVYLVVCGTIGAALGGLVTWLVM